LPLPTGALVGVSSLDSQTFKIALQLPTGSLVGVQANDKSVLAAQFDLPTLSFVGMPTNLVRLSLNLSKPTVLFAAASTQIGAINMAAWLPLVNVTGLRLPQGLISMRVPRLTTTQMRMVQL
jgi:hypothetical protein